MKIYMDENVPQKVASRVREEGYVVEYKDKLRGACGFLSEGILDVRRPLRSP